MRARKHTRGRPALRLAARAALFAVIGAAATVVVAWGFAYWGRDNQNGPVRTNVPFSVPMEGWPEAVDKAFESKEPGLRLGFEYAVRNEEHFGVVSTDAGWPLLGMRGYSAGARPVDWRPASGIDLGPQSQRGMRLEERSSPFFMRHLPVVPLWPGFAVDTVFYGGLAFVVWGAPGLVRRRVRRRRGRCAACGYDLSGAGGAGGGVCPECGGGGA